jgi:PKD repeat protein
MVQRNPTRLTLTARPHVGEIPLSVTFYADVRGGSDTEPRLYCAEASWDFGNETYVERHDCPPLEDGGVTIRRTYTQTHTYRNPGSYEVRLTLMQKGEPVLYAVEKVTSVRPGFK